MNYLKGLVVSGVGGLSLGRVTFVILLGLAAWAWGHGRDIPYGHLVTLLTCFGYLLGGKGISKIKDIEFGKSNGEGRK